MKRYRPTSHWNERIVSLIRTLPRVQVQNALMRRSDREIGVAMMQMTDEDREFALAFLPQAKADRVRDEVAYQRRLKITLEQYERVAQIVVNALTGVGGTGKTSTSYVRPRNDRRRYRP